MNKGIVNSSHDLKNIIIPGIKKNIHDAYNGCLHAAKTPVVHRIPSMCILYMVFALRI